jgi:hypothetical protein
VFGSKVDYRGGNSYGGGRRYNRHDRERDDYSGSGDDHRHRQFYWNNSRKRQRTMSGSETGSEGVERGRRGGGGGGAKGGGDLASKTLVLVNNIVTIQVN